MATAQDAGVPVQSSKSYLLGPGDEITAKVMGEPDYDFTAIVNEDGKIELPFIDEPIVAKCRTERQLRTDITTALGKFLRTPQLSLRTLSKSRPDTSLYGEVRNPQKLVLMRKVTLSEMMAFSGGVNEEAGGLVQVFRTHQPMCSSDGDEGNWKAETSDPTDVPYRTYSLSNVRAGKEGSNPVIYPGDVIYIPKALPVYVVGEVVAPQGLYIKEEGLTLMGAITKVSGLGREAKSKDIKIYRLKPGSTDREIISANYEQIQKNLQKDIILEPQDIVEVGRKKDSVAQTILKFALGAGKTVVSSGANSIGYKVVY